MLDDDKNEEVEHDVGVEEDHGDKVGWCKFGPACFTINAVRLRLATIIHYDVPVLTCRDREEQEETLIEDCEVLVLVNDITRFDFTEHELTHDGQDEE